VFVGDDLVSWAYTQEQAQRRRIVHADLLAMDAADRTLGMVRPDAAVTLAVNLEPCMMCLGAAITLGVERVVYSLESPNDGAVALLDAWTPPVQQSFFRRPAVVEGGVLREESKALFARYAEGDGPRGMRVWADGLARQDP
jgi:tRNA(adenine34) deaminase